MLFHKKWITIKELNALATNVKTSQLIIIKWKTVKEFI